MTKNDEEARIPLFVSYSRQDKSRVSAVIASLKDAGYHVWYDAHDIEPGHYFAKEIKKNIETCCAFFIFLSRNSIASEWCQLELDWARTQGKKVIPVALEKDLGEETSTISFYTNGIERINLFPEDSLDDFLGRLNPIPELRDAWKPPRKPAPLPQTQEGFNGWDARPYQVVFLGDREANIGDLINRMTRKRTWPPSGVRLTRWDATKLGCPVTLRILR